jgi:hypothetical protein
MDAKPRPATRDASEPGLDKANPVIFGCRNFLRAPKIFRVSPHTLVACGEKKIKALGGLRMPVIGGGAFGMAGRTLQSTKSRRNAERADKNPDDTLSTTMLALRVGTNLIVSAFYLPPVHGLWASFFPFV